jgi:hypothetical protein
VLFLLEGADGCSIANVFQTILPVALSSGFAGWFGKQWQASSISRAPSYIRSLPAQAMIVVSVLVLVIAVAGVGSGAQNHVVWILCYGFLLAWIAGWNGNRRQTRL